MLRELRSIVCNEAKKRQCKEDELINAAQYSKTQGRLYLDIVRQFMNQSLTPVDPNKEHNGDLGTRLAWYDGYNTALKRLNLTLLED